MRARVRVPLRAALALGSARREASAEHACSANTPMSVRAVAGHLVCHEVAHFVARGALNEELFADSAGELFFIYAKLFPYVGKVRENNPLFMA